MSFFTVKGREVDSVSKNSNKIRKIKVEIGVNNLIFNMIYDKE